MTSKVVLSVVNLLFLGFTSLAAQTHQVDSALDQYVEQASEFSSRARANVYFPNPQSIFNGVQVSFVNVGTGNLTFLRRDMVTSGRIPIVVARVYDSSSNGSAEFGPGWRLSAAETISLENQKARLSTESGSEIVFVESRRGIFQLEKDRPSDYSHLLMTAPDTFRLSLRTGLTKEFKLMGKEFRLTRVTDRNGNELRLLYQNGLLSRIENTNHAIALSRTKSGRIFLAQDDQGRRVGFQYDDQSRLIEVDDRGGHAWRYSYGEGGKIRTATDPLGRLNLSAGFDERDRVHTLQLPSGSIQYRYDLATRSTVVTDRRQLTSRFFQNEEGITTKVLNALGEETAITLDSARNVSSLARNGSVLETMQYDQQHRVQFRRSTIDSGTIDRQYSYDPATGLLSGIQASGGVLQAFGYDPAGNLTSASLPDGTRNFTFTSPGDLSSFSIQGTQLIFTPDSDGQIASMREGKDNTSFAYEAGGELSEVAFPTGMRAEYKYQLSGLRSKMIYKDGRRVEYAYDPAGNLTSTKVFNRQGAQVNGQLLEMNDSYQLVRWVLFDGTETTLQYDPNGNLTEIKKGKSTTKFEYDGLDRLTAVITPSGQRLTYSYKPGERSLMEQYEHANVGIADLRDTGLTFAGAFNIISSRPVNAMLGSVRFSDTLGAFQLANADGSEIVRPNESIEGALAKLHLYQSGMTQKALQSGFSAPLNTMFVPAEYLTINCCPGCYYDGNGNWECPPCNGGGGVGPPDHLMVDSDLLTTVNCAYRTLRRTITYEVDDLNGNQVPGPYSFSESFDNITSTCGTPVTDTSCETNPFFPDLLIDNLSTYWCQPGDCEVVLTHQRWFICGVFPFPIGSPGTIDAHPTSILVNGTTFFPTGTLIFP